MAEEPAFVPIIVTPEVLLALQAATPESARKRRQDRKLHQGDCQKSGGVCQLDHIWLTYVDSRYVQQVLDTEVGPANWQDKYMLGEGGKVSCLIGIRVRFAEGPEWVWKGDGAGATDIEGDKGSFSDAFKRAAVQWGIARDLYDEKPITTQGQGTATAGGVSRDGVVTQVGDVPPVQTAPAAPSPQPVAVPASHNDPGDKCPVHQWAWSVQPGGTSKSGKAYGAFYKCGGKTNGSYCHEKPSEEWVKAHPIPR